MIPMLKQEVFEKLNKTFDQSADQIEFIDERGDGHHYMLHIISDKFEGKNRLARSRMVYSCLGDFLDTGKIHALRLKLQTKSENNA